MWEDAPSSAAPGHTMFPGCCTAISLQLPQPCTSGCKTRSQAVLQHLHFSRSGVEGRQLLSCYCALSPVPKNTHISNVLVESRLFLRAALYKQLTMLLSFSLKMKFRRYISSAHTVGGAPLEVLTAFTAQCTDVTPTSFPVKTQFI